MITIPKLEKCIESVIKNKNNPNLGSPSASVNKDSLDCGECSVIRTQSGVDSNLDQYIDLYVSLKYKNTDSTRVKPPSCSMLYLIY